MFNSNTTVLFYFKFLLEYNWTMVFKHQYSTMEMPSLKTLLKSLDGLLKSNEGHMHFQSFFSVYMSKNIWRLLIYQVLIVFPLSPFHRYRKVTYSVTRGKKKEARNILQWEAGIVYNLFFDNFRILGIFLCIFLKKTTYWLWEISAQDGDGGGSLGHLLP